MPDVVEFVPNLAKIPVKQSSETLLPLPPAVPVVYHDGEAAVTDNGSSAADPRLLRTDRRPAGRTLPQQRALAHPPTVMPPVGPTAS